jgi:hypothetical protein
LHSSGARADFYPLDFRIYDPEGDGKTKNQHFREMLLRAQSDKNLQARTVLFDSWYGSVDNLQLIEFLGLFFVTTLKSKLKSNRLVSVRKEQGYIHLQDIEWTPQQLHEGVLVKLKELPFLVRLFKIVAPNGDNGDIDWLITNRPHTGEGESGRGRKRAREKAGEGESGRGRKPACDHRAGRAGTQRRALADRTTAPGTQATRGQRNSWAAKNASAARPVHSATTWPAVIWRG